MGWWMVKWMCPHFPNIYFPLPNDYSFHTTIF
jgi:hypothetical protein